jgi:thymidylate kinase
MGDRYGGLNMKKPMLINMLGIDGCGKTAQCRKLEAFLAKEGYKVAYVWIRREPYISKIPAKLFKKFVLKEPEKTEGEAYLHIKRNRTVFFKNRMLRFFWINFSLVEYFFLIYRRAIIPNLGCDILLCDRYLYDAIIDFALSCSLSPVEVSKLMAGCIIKIFPLPALIYFIDIDAEIGAKRKSDGTSVVYLQDRVPIYKDCQR